MLKYFNRKGIKPYLYNVMHLAFTVFTMLFIICIFNPVYLSRNTGSGLYLGILLAAAGICAVTSLIVGCLAFLLKDKYWCLEGLVLGFLLAVFIISFIFPFKTDILDGGELTAISVDASAAVRGLVIIIMCVDVGYYMRKRIRFIAFPMLIVCLALTGINYIPYEKSTYEYSDIIASIRTFSSEKNIFVIGIDTLQGIESEKMLVDNPDFSDAFDGFTLFARAFTGFPHTKYGKPMVTSGKIYTLPSNSNWNENRTAAIADSFLTDLQNRGARVDVLETTQNNKLFPTIYNIETNDTIKDDYFTALAASAARVTGYWFVMGLSDKIDNQLRSKLISRGYYENILTNFSVGDSEPKCLYFWDFSIHGPLAFGRDGTIKDRNMLLRSDEVFFEFSQLSLLFEHMKAAGVYDNSLIIITSDHGNNQTNDFYKDVVDFPDGNKHFGSYMQLGVYNSAFFVKPPYATGKTEITYNPAWNGDVRALVNYYFDNFRNISATEVQMLVRAQNPVVDVIYVDNESRELERVSSAETHQIIQASSLYEIGPAIAAQTGVYDK